MRRLHLVWLLVILVLLLAGVGLMIFQKEPVYEGRPISEWIMQLTGGVGGTASAVASPVLPKLVQQQPGPEAVPYLRKTLRRGTTPLDRVYLAIFPKLPARISKKLPAPNPPRDAQLRYRSALILYYMGPAAQGAIPVLIRALHDEDVQVRRVAASVLGNLNSAAAKAAPGLMRLLGDQTVEVRRAALKALRAVDPDQTEVIFKCAEMLKDPDDGVRTDAAQMLKDFGPAAKVAVRALIKALEDKNADVFRFAAQSLGKIGPDAQEAVPGLMQALREKKPFTETTIRWALNQIDPDALAKADDAASR